MRLRFLAICCTLIALSVIVAVCTSHADDHCTAKSTTAAGRRAGACPLHGCCPRHRCCPKECGCDYPCKTPCDNDQPRGREEDELRGGPPGGFFTPPPTGVVQGATRGVELPGVSVTFPELTVSMPKIRLRGMSRTRQDARMHMEGGVAPFVPGGPSFGAVPLMGAPGAPDQGRGKRDEDESPRSKKEDEEPRSKDCNCSKPSSPVQKRGSPVQKHQLGATTDMHDRLGELKSQIEQQTELLRQSMAELAEIERSTRDLDSNRRMPVTAHVPGDPPQPIPDPGDSAKRIRLLPQIEEEPLAPAKLDRAAYWETASRKQTAEPTLIRLPATGSKSSRTQNR